MVDLNKWRRTLTSMLAWHRSAQFTHIENTWALTEFGSSSWYTLLFGSFLPLFFAQRWNQAYPNDPTGNRAVAAWCAFSGVAYLCGGVLSILLSYPADFFAIRTHILILTSIVLCCLTLYLPWILYDGDTSDFEDDIYRLSTWLALVLFLFCISVNFNNGFLLLVTEGNAFNQNSVLFSLTGILGATLVMLPFSILFFCGFSLRQMLCAASIAGGIMWIISQLPFWWSLRNFKEATILLPSERPRRFGSSDDAIPEKESSLSTPEQITRSVSSEDSSDASTAMSSSSATAVAKSVEVAVSSTKLSSRKSTAVSTGSTNNETTSKVRRSSSSEDWGYHTYNDDDNWTPRAQFAGKRSCWEALRHCDRNFAKVLVAMFIYGDVMGTMSHNVMVFAKANIGFPDEICVFFTLLNRMSGSAMIIAIITSTFWSFASLSVEKTKIQEMKVDLGGENKNGKEMKIKTTQKSIELKTAVPNSDFAVDKAMSKREENDNEAKRKKQEMGKDKLFEGDIGSVRDDINSPSLRVDTDLPGSPEKRYKSLILNIEDGIKFQNGKKKIDGKKFLGPIPLRANFGKLSTKYSFVLLYTVSLICILICILISDYLMGSKFGQFLAFITVTILLGACTVAQQVLSKSVLAGLVAPNEQANVFGLLSLLGRVSGVVGPLTFAAAGFIFGAARDGYFVLAAQQIVAIILLLCADIPEQESVKEKETMTTRNNPISMPMKFDNETGAVQVY
eukprot:g3026.t1